MAATYHTRIKRLQRLEALLPPPTTAPADCPDGTRLRAILVDAYGQASETTSRRALQRDLEELTQEGRIETVNPGGKPLRYRRRGDDAEEDALIWQYNLQQVRDLIAETVPTRRLDRLWQRLLNEFDGPLLDERRLRLVPDTLRLQPVELYPAVLQAVIGSLAQHCALLVLYKDSAGVRTEATLHPQALVQRGPIPYLFALKNDETEPVRLYALHRMIRAQAVTATPARTAAGFDLDTAIATGTADFGQGTLIDLDLRVRGYLATLLSCCPLTPDQRLEDEPEGSGFTLRVRAQLPSTGQLLRWLLGAGDNLEVIAPANLRQIMATQASKMAAHYREE
jgi:predicted DNA-binding transcriptional regulator YafY